MPCLTPYRGDTSQMLLFKIASCLAEGSGGVLSFNGQTGAVTFTGGDIITLLGFTPISQADGDSRYVLKAGDTMTGNLVHPDGTAALPSITFTGDLDTGIYHPAANTIGLTAGGALIFAVSPTGVNLTTALAYQYNSVNVIRAQTALNNYYFGPSGNLTATGTDNTSVGFNALVSNTTGSSNSAFGVDALRFNTSGVQNSAFGIGSLRANVDGVNNSAFGRFALTNNTSGTNNVAFGTNTLLVCTSGGDNCAFGVSSLSALTTGSSNLGVGTGSLSSATTAASSCAIGINALLDLTTGMQNTALGFNTGRGITTGSNNTILGANVTGLAAGLANNIVIADGSGNQRITVGSTGIVSIPIALTLGTAAPLSMTSGANQRAGNAVLVAGTVTVANTTVTANTIVLLTRKTAGGTLGTAITYTVIAGTSFTINSDSVIDTSTFSYLLVEVP